MFERSSATDLHTHFDVKTLEKRRFEQLLCYMYKMSHKEEMIVQVEDLRTRGDRKVKFEIDPYRYKTMQKCPYYRGVWEWNDLPLDTQKSVNINIFKKNIDDKQHRVALV